MLIKNHSQSTGFTIVELLIVVVVIAILATITIISYNGIQNRAKQSSAQTLVAQVGKKILAYSVQNSDSYPPNLNAIDISAADQQNLQYSVNNSANPKTFGLTGTIGAYSYYVSNLSTSPTAGGYPGHGQGGTPPIKNIATNPSFESSLLANTFNSSNSHGSGGGYSGSRFLRSTRANTSGASGPWINAATVEGGKVYRVTFAARGNVPTPRDFNIEWINTTNNSLVNRVTLSSITPTSTWSIYTATATAPTGADQLRLAIYTISSSTGTTSDYMDLDALMITETSANYDFADGNSANWAWDGTVNNSTSTGPAL